MTSNETNGILEDMVEEAVRVAEKAERESVDLRLLGILGKGSPVRQASRILPFTWGAFIVSAVS